MESILLVGGVAGLGAFFSWMVVYLIIFPKWLRNWFEASVRRIFILDIFACVIAGAGLNSVGGSITAVVGSITLGVISSIFCLCRVMIKKAKSFNPLGRDNKWAY